MSDPGNRHLPVILATLLSWAAGLLTGVLLAAVYSLLHPPKAPSLQSAVSYTTGRPAPTPSPTPDCPARELWSSCDPVPHTMEEFDRALMSHAVGWIDIITTSGQWHVKVDGISYGLMPPWEHQPIAPGQHVLDLFDFQGMQHVRCDLDIRRGGRFRALVGTGANCIVSEIAVTDAR